MTATGDATALAGIMRLVPESQNNKSSTQILADKAAGWLFYVAPVGILLSPAVGVVLMSLSTIVVALNA